MKIYTKTGDKGKTSLLNGARIYKDHKRVDTYGTIDELNTLLGVVAVYLSPQEQYTSHFSAIITSIQNDLFVIGAYLANPSPQPDNIFFQQLDLQITYFEKTIDELTSKMPELTNFILPGGGFVGAFLQLSRTVCRRAERQIVALSHEEIIDKSILVYINRLSDLLYTMSRYANYKENKSEVIWKKYTG